VRMLLRSGQYSEALELTRTDESYFSKVLHAGLREANHGFSAVIRSLDEVTSRLDGAIDDYMIGGGALAIRGLKDATKDVDMILRTENDLKVIVSTLEAMGYESTMPADPAYEQLAPRRIYAKEGAPQVDLFVRQVCNALLLSPGIIERATPEPGFGNLRLHRVASSDILIFKSITERKADEGDIEALLAAGVDWTAVLDEVRWQVRYSERAWSRLLFERMEEFSERGHGRPVLGELETLVDRDVGEKLVLLCLGERIFTRHELYAKIKEDPEWVDACISALLDQGRITHTRGGLRKTD
jgi:hypothetical protein